MSNVPFVAQLFDDALQCAKSGSLKEAEEMLLQILQLEPEHLRSLDLMGYVQYFLKKPSEAKGYCEAALRIKPDHAYALKGLGLCLAACGQVDEGITHLQKAVSVAPHYFDPYWDLAVTLARSGRVEDACKQIDAAISAFPAQQQRLLGLKEVVESGKIK